MAPPSASQTPASSSSSPPAGSIAVWRVMLRITGALFAVVILSYWVAAGSNTGWTKDNVTTMKTDEVTGIEYPEVKKHFVPGIEFLAIGVGCGVALIGATFLFRKRSNHPHTS